MCLCAGVRACLPAHVYACSFSHVCQMSSSHYAYELMQIMHTFLPPSLSLSLSLSLFCTSASLRVRNHAVKRVTVVHLMSQAGHDTARATG